MNNKDGSYTKSISTQDTCSKNDISPIDCNKNSNEQMMTRYQDNFSDIQFPRL